MDATGLGVFWAVYSAALRLLAALYVAVMVIFVVDCLRSLRKQRTARPKEASSAQGEEPLYRLMRPAAFQAELSELEARRCIRFTERERLALYAVAIAAGIEQAELRAAEEAEAEAQR